MVRSRAFCRGAEWDNGAGAHRDRRRSRRPCGGDSRTTSTAPGRTHRFTNRHLHADRRPRREATEAARHRPRRAPAHGSGMVLDRNLADFQPRRSAASPLDIRQRGRESVDRCDTCRGACRRRCSRRRWPAAPARGPDLQLLDAHDVGPALLDDVGDPTQVLRVRRVRRERAEIPGQDTQPRHLSGPSRAHRPSRPVCHASSDGPAVSRTRPPPSTTHTARCRESRRSSTRCTAPRTSTGRNTGTFRRRPPGQGPRRTPAATSSARTRPANNRASPSSASSSGSASGLAAAVECVIMIRRHFHRS